MSIADLYRAVKLAKKRPKVIAVSSETWATLKKAGVIEMKAHHPFAMFKEAEKFPAMQGDIFIVVNPALDAEKKAFAMPMDAGEVRAEKQERRRGADRRKGPRRRAEDDKPKTSKELAARE